MKTARSPTDSISDRFRPFRLTLVVRVSCRIYQGMWIITDCSPCDKFEISDLWHLRLTIHACDFSFLCSPTSWKTIDVPSIFSRHFARQDICRELCDIASRWPEEDEDEDHEAETAIFLRLEEALMKLSTSAQEQVVGSFRPLKQEVSRRLAEWTNEFNDWLSEAGRLSLEPAHLGELLREVIGSPQFLWYRQCPKARVKAKFLMAVASLIRALIEGKPLVKPMMDTHPDLESLAQKMMKRLFVLPDLGNILEIWHEGRLACYNATLSLAAQRAADKLRDDLQVSLVSAVKRATAATAGPEEGPKGGPKGPKGALQLQLRDWPMTGCPLARALLEFLKSHASELGDLGRPSLRECPPHSLKPATLRDLLCRLDAFEVVGSGPSVVRLRFEAVAALAYKAVGTKPKAGAVPPKPPKGPVPIPSPPPGASNQEGHMEYFDSSDVSSMSRLIRRGLRAGDEEWRQAWTQFCWTKNISSRLSRRNTSQLPPQEVLKTFLENHFTKLKRAPWARSLGRARRDGHREAPGRDGRRRREASVSSSSFSSRQSRDRRRKKRSRRERPHRDFFNANKTMTPEVMMMRAQMMGVSMVMNSMNNMNNMNNPMAMMQMRTPLPMPQAPNLPLPPPPPPPPKPPPKPRSGPISSKAAPLAQAAAVARKQQQESTIDMDDLWRAWIQALVHFFGISSSI